LTNSTPVLAPPRPVRLPEDHSVGLLGGPQALVYAVGLSSNRCSLPSSATRASGALVRGGGLAQQRREPSRGHRRGPNEVEDSEGFETLARARDATLELGSAGRVSLPVGLEGARCLSSGLGWVGVRSDCPGTATARLSCIDHHMGVWSGQDSCRESWQRSTRPITSPTPPAATTPFEPDAKRGAGLGVALPAVRGTSSNALSRSCCQSASS
jgi:hypothetical protein